MEAAQIPMFSTNKHRKAFTLIELLVVIAIIAILAAILFPVFARARENARRSSCQSNLKQIGLGIFQYTQDYDEKYVPSETNNPQANWGQLVQPYLKSTQVFSCPSNTNNSGTTPASTMTGGGAAPLPVIPASYAMNYHIGRSGGTTGNALSLASINSVSQKILVAESSTSENGQGWNDWDDNNHRYRDNAFAGHLNTENFLFADGHVKSLRPVATASNFNMWGQTLGNSSADGTDCGTAWSINCDKSSSGLISNMGEVEDKYK